MLFDKNSPKAEKPKQSAISEVFDYLEIMIIALCAVFLLFTVSVRLCRVDGSSMKPTLENGQPLLISDLFYTPKSGDIIVFHQSNNENESMNKPLVKRVIATAGQYYKIECIEMTGENGVPYGQMKVYISDDAVFEESERLDESYIDFETISSGNYEAGYGNYKHHAQRPAIIGQVPDGKLFVMGDNRYNSDDSRGRVGYVDVDCVLGKLVLRLAPFGNVK